MSSDESLDIKINPTYAQKYEEKKRQEEISKLKEKYGDMSIERLEMISKEEKRRKGFLTDDDDESTSEDEDDEGELLTPQVDVQIMKTIGLIKTKAPEIYNPQVKFFPDEGIDKVEEKKKEPKPIHLTDYHRESLLEKGRLLKSDKSVDIPQKTIADEEKDAKEQLRDALFKNKEESSDDDEEFFSKKEKTSEELRKEEEDYRNFLLESLGTEANIKSAFEDWRDYSNNDKLDENERFLMDYILNKGWVAKNGQQQQTLETIDDDEDLEALDQADNFESKYNFRFEEEGGSQIMTYSRNIENSLRRKNDHRKLKRKEVSERKQEEKKKKIEELKRLKNLKKKEIFDKMKKIQEITGNPHVGFDKIDLEGDFDPEKYDSQMNRVFDDDYYKQEDGEKPQFDDDIDISDILPPRDNSHQENPEEGKNLTKSQKKRLKRKMKEKANEEEEFIMDADYLDQNTSSNIQSESKEKEMYKFINDYINENYQLDYEDMIGDLPTRFKYRKVEPESFGLTSQEILLAEDEDLNAFLSLKKLAPYRPPHVIEKEKKKIKRSRKLKELKDKLKDKDIPEFKVTEKNHKKGKSRQ